MLQLVDITELKWSFHAGIAVHRNQITETTFWNSELYQRFTGKYL